MTSTSKTTKRLLSLLITLILSVTVITVTAFASVTAAATGGDEGAACSQEVSSATISESPSLSEPTGDGSDVEAISDETESEATGDETATDIDVSTLGDPVETWDISATTSDSVTANLYNDPENEGYYVLVISGTGKMKEWSSASSVPWYSYRTKITTIKIDNDVTNVGSYAFYNYTRLTSVTIGNSVTSIGKSAFYYCSSLTSVIIPDSVTSIGWEAFSRCTSLTSVVFSENSQLTSIDWHAFNSCKSLASINIPDSVTSIGYYAFNSCKSLASINIPDSVTSIGNWAFSGCSNLANINVDENNTAFKSIDGNLYSKDETVLIQYATGKTDTEFVIPDSVTSIGDYAFEYCSSLTSVTIGNSVTSIGKSAFYYCSNLTSVTIPDSVTSIGGAAFDECTSLTSVYITDITAWYNISFYSSAANPLYYAKNLYLNGELVTEFVIPEDIETIGDYAFEGCKSLTSINIPDSVTSIGNRAFSGCSNLASVTIPDSVTSIGDYAFEYCSSLTNVHITDIAAWCDISFGNSYANPLYYAKNLYLNGELVTDLVIPEGVETIGNYAFQNCTSLTSVTIGDSVTSIGNEAFSGCTSLTSVTIPDSVTSIGLWAFSSCSSLTSVTIPDSVTSIGSYAFRGCSSLTSINIPSSVTSIGSYAFQNDSNLKLVIIDSPTIASQLTSSTSCGYLVNYAQTVLIDPEITSVGSYVTSNFTYVDTLDYVDADGNVKTYAVYSKHSHADDATTWVEDSESGTSYCSSCGVVTLSHRWSDWTVTVYPTEDAAGEMQRTCSHCTEIDTFLLPILSTDSIYNFVETPATCTTDGEKIYSVTKNNQTISFIVVIESKGHILPEESDDYLEPGCTTVGGSIYKCENCDYFELRDTVAPIGHRIDGESCTNCGKAANTSLQYVFSEEDQSYTVTGIGDVDDGDVIVPSIHNGYPVTKIATQAFYANESIVTITLPSSIQHIGKYAFHSCSSLLSLFVLSDDIAFGGERIVYNCDSLSIIYFSCNSELVADFELIFRNNITTVYNFGHNIILNDSYDGTCTEDGYKVYICTDEGCDRSYSVIEKAAGHVIDEIKAATCTEDGHREGVCSACNQYIYETIPAKGHIADFYTTIESTCTDFGTATGVCEVCSDEVLRIIPALGHASGEFIASGEICNGIECGDTCCTRCGATLSHIGHSYERSVTLEPTCTENGIARYTCSSCESYYENAIITNGHGNLIETVIKDAGCEENGTKHFICEVCDAVVFIQAINSTSHSYDTSEFVDGILIYTCSKCGVTKQSENVISYCTVTFCTGTELSIAPLLVPYGEAYSFDYPMYDGFIFIGWYYDPAFKTIYGNEAITKDLTLYARWEEESVEYEYNENKLEINVDQSFTFIIDTDIAIDENNVRRYVKIYDHIGNEVEITATACEGGYEIAGQYAKGQLYRAVISNDVSFRDRIGNELRFIIADDEVNNLEYRENTVKIYSDDIVNAFREETSGNIFIALENSIVNIGDILLVLEPETDKLMSAFEVAAKHSGVDVTLYECVVADVEDIIENFELYYSDDLIITEDMISDSFKEEWISSFQSSAMYAQLLTAANVYASTKEMAYYSIGDPKFEVDFEKNDDFNVFTVLLKVSIKFEKNKYSDAPDGIPDYYLLSVTVKDTIALNATSSGKYTKSSKYFNFVVDVDNSTEIDTSIVVGYEESLDELPDQKSIIKFAKILKECRDKGSFISQDTIFKHPELSTADQDNRIVLIPTQHFVIAGVVDIQFGLNINPSWSFVGELGANLNFHQRIKLGVEAVGKGYFKDFSPISSMDTGMAMSLAVMGKYRADLRLEMDLSIALLGDFAKVTITGSIGPYTEIAGMISVVVDPENNVKAVCGGYMEFGIAISINLRITANIIIDDVVLYSRNLFEIDIPILSAGNKKVPLYFTNSEEDITVSTEFGSAININGSDPFENATMMAIRDFGDISLAFDKYIENSDYVFKYALINCDYSNVSLSEIGELTIYSGYETSYQLKIKLSYGDIYKIINLNVIIDHDHSWNSVTSYYHNDGYCRSETTHNCTGNDGCQFSYIEVNYDNTKYEIIAEIDIFATVTEKGHAHSTCSLCHSNLSTNVCDLHKMVGYDTPDLTVTDGLAFELSESGGYWILTDIGTATATEINIPKEYTKITIDGNALTYPVKVIGENAFKDCTTITKVTIPNSVTGISNSAFEGCSSLVTIVISDSITWIENHAFLNCEALDNVYITDLDKWLSVSFPHYSYNDSAASNPLCYADNLYLNGHAVTEVNLPDGITTITPYMLSFSSLERVTIPSSVTSIGSYAFYECTSLTSISIPEGVTVIEYGTFYNCSSLISVTIPDSVTYIYEDALHGCSSLESITLPFIGEVKDAPQYHYLGYVFGQWSSYYDHASYVPKSLKSVTITNGSTIPGGAFYNCASIVTINLSDSITSIGADAFYGCSSLLNINIPNSTTSIGESAFYECTSLTSVTIPNSVTIIDHGAFHWCDNLTSVTIGNSVTNIGSYAFQGCSSLTSIIFGENSKLASICEYAFSYCSNLEAIAIPEAVTTIGEGVFSRCSNLSNISFGTNSRLAIIDTYAFYECTNLINITIPDSVTNIGMNAFEGCSSLESITIPFVGESRDSTDCTVFKYIFAYHIPTFENESYIPTSLKTVTITNASSISDKAFAGCENIVTIHFGDNCQIENIGDGAFTDCSGLESINISNGVTSIGNKAFYGCTNLTSVTIPDSVTSIGNSAFYGCEDLTNITIPEGVTIIEYDTFYNCSSLTSITIPDSVTSIEDRAFFGCSCITSVNFGTDSQLESIHYDVFNGCSSLISINVPDSVTQIASDAFEGCSSLESITLPFVGANKDETGSTHFGHIFGASTYEENETYVPASLKNVIITRGSNIYPYAFNQCSNLISITLSDSITSIGDAAFYKCSNLISVTLPKGLTRIEDHAFNSCENLKNIRIPDGVTSIGQQAFFNCSGLESINIPINVTIIEESAFSECNNLISVIVPNSVTQIEKHAFYDCSNLESITLPFIGDCKTEPYYVNFGYLFGASSHYDHAAYVPESLKTVTITNASTIPDSAFSGCESIITINLNDSVTSIGASAFSGCSSLTGITFGDCSILASIGESAFSVCSSLESINIPDSVTSIGTGAFAHCTNLQEIVIPENTLEVAFDAFTFCDSMKLLVINSPEVAFAPPTITLEDLDVTFAIPTSITEIGIDTYLYPLTATISYTDIEGETVSYNLYSKHSHDDSEMWIDLSHPATFKEDGFSGSQCSVCGIIQGRELPMLKYGIYAANLTLGSDLSIKVYAILDELHVGAQMRFTMNDRAVTVNGVYSESLGMYCYRFNGINPQCMGDLITIELILDGEVLGVIENYSVKAYCEKIFSMGAADLGLTEEKYEQLVILMNSMLEYGAQAQLYSGYKTDALVNDGITAPEYAEITETDKLLVKHTEIDGVGFTAANLRFENVNKLYFKFKAPDISKLNVRLTLRSETYHYTSDAFVESSGSYILYTDDILATGFDDVYTITLVYDGVDVQTFTYSVRSYVYSKQNDIDENGNLTAMAKFARATYLYGRAAKAFNDK